MRTSFRNSVKTDQEIKPNQEDSNLSIRTAHALYSAVIVMLSKAALVSQLALASRKWKAIHTMPFGTCPVTLALTLTSPRRDVTRIVSPWAMFRLAASSRRNIGGLLAQNIVQPLAAAGLGPGVIMGQAAAGAEDKGIFRIRHFGRRGPVYRFENAQAAGELSVFVQDAGAGMVFVRAGPLQAVAFQAVVFDAAPVGAPEPRFHCPRSRVALSEAHWCPKRLAISLKIHQLGLAWPGAALAVRTRLTRRSLLVKVPSFSLQAAAGKITWANRVVSLGKISWHDQELGRSQLMLHFADVGLGIGQVFTENVEPADLAADQPLHHLGNHQAIGTGQGLDTPRLFRTCPGSRDR